MTAPTDPQACPAAVVAEVAARGIRLDDGTRFPLWIRFTYDPADPYALLLTISDRSTFTGVDVTAWTIARETVYIGCELRGSAGQGDFYATYISEQTVQFVLHATNPGEVSVLLEVPRPKLSAFLQRTEALAPVGRESEIIDLDTLTTRLLRGY